MLKISKKIGKIAIVGFGQEGKSLANFLYRRLDHKDITICDKNLNIQTKNFSTIQRSLNGRKINIRAPRYKFQLGKNYLKNLLRFDIIYLSPGVPPHLKALRQAQGKKNIKISSATELFFNLCPAKIIGITGTKGKGTVATMLYLMIKPQKDAELHAERRGNLLQKNRKKIFLVGNIGKPAISILPRLTKKDLVIMELSSFQLQNLKKSPHIAIVLKITSDHLDYHKNQKEYFEAKTNILRRQKPRDIAIINKKNKKIKILKKLGKSKKILFYTDSINSSLLKDIDFKKLKIPGKHNLENVIAAAITAKILKVKTKDIQFIINNFKGRKHRLEFVKNIGGVKYYNDSAATNPDATIAAILSFNQPKILIMGGQSKKNNYKPLTKIIKKSNVKKIILFGENKKEIARALTKLRKNTKVRNRIVLVTNLKQAIKIAKKSAEKGDVVLFSPASASFDQFKNYEERGMVFKKEL